MTDTATTGDGGLLGKINKPLFALTGGFILLFCIYALVDIDGLSAHVDGGFAFSARHFGFYWQILLLAAFLIGLVLCVLPGGRTVMGGLATPEFKIFNWGSMIMCTLLAGGGVFRAAGEPIAHFLSTPPIFGDAPAALLAITNAMPAGFILSILILISTGSGGIGKLQSFIVVTAVPVSLVLLPSLRDALRITLMLGRK